MLRLRVSKTIDQTRLSARFWAWMKEEGDRITPEEINTTISNSPSLFLLERDDAAVFLLTEPAYFKGMEKKFREMSARAKYPARIVARYILWRMFGVV